MKKQERIKRKDNDLLKEIIVDKIRLKDELLREKKVVKLWDDLFYM